MIKIEGTLRVKKILQSKNGPFSVGTFSTEIGEFKVKDQVLEQFDEGIYQVSAWLVRVFPTGYPRPGGFAIEQRAQLHDLQVQSEETGIDAAAENEAAFEPDPIDEPPPVKPAAEASQETETSFEELKAKLKSIGGRSRSRKDVPPATTAQAQAEATREVRALFSQDLWALIEAHQQVKLDSAIDDRALLRQQGYVLREQLGYRFNPLDQTFYPV